jgi:hypothetical protein
VVGDDGIDRESMEFEEDKGVFRLVDESNLRSSCSRKLLKEEEKKNFFIC